MCARQLDAPYQYAWRHYGASLLFQTVLPVRDTSKRTLEGKRDQVIPEGAIAVFTDGSKEPQGIGAGIFFNGLLEDDLYIPLGRYANVFQAETYAILLCSSILKTLDLAEEPACSDSLSAIRALHRPRITSKLTRWAGQSPT